MKSTHLLFFALALCACTQQERSLEPHQPDFSAKILSTKSGATTSELCIKLDRAPSEQDLEELTLQGVVSITRTLPSAKGKEALEAKHGLDRWYTVEISDPTEADALAAQYASLSNVQVVEYGLEYERPSNLQPDYSLPAPITKASSGSVFNDPLLGSQWHYINKGNASIKARKGADINVEAVWESLTRGDSDIIVAVVDEGIKYNHPDLAANMWINPGEIPNNGIDDDGNGYIDDVYGYNFVTNGAISWAEKGDSGHGTHTAGTIAAVNNNGKGVSGVAGGSGKGDGVKIMSCQVLSGEYGGTSSQSAKAYKYAADNGASLVSASIGFKGGAYNSDTSFKKVHGIEYDALQYFEACANNDILDGNIAIFSSGNDNLPYAGYPGAVANIISVSAFGPDFLPSSYTNYGPGCNITAPGGDINRIQKYEAGVLSTFPSELSTGGQVNKDYAYYQGTSMSCPHVTGVVALGLSYAKKLGKKFGREDFKQMILSSTNDFETVLSSSGDASMSKYRGKMGTGAIDAWRLMMKIEGTPCLSAVAGEKQWIDLSEHFGSSSINLEYTDIEYTEADAAKIGLKEKPEIKFGRLYIHPTECGSIKMRIHAIGGGNILGGGDAIGGMAISQEVSIVVRSVKSKNGAWL